MRNVDVDISTTVDIDPIEVLEQIDNEEIFKYLEGKMEIGEILSLFDEDDLKLALDEIDLFSNEKEEVDYDFLVESFWNGKFDINKLIEKMGIMGKEELLKRIEK